MSIGKKTLVIEWLLIAYPRSTYVLMYVYTTYYVYTVFNGGAVMLLMMVFFF